ncbi:hypothetical protein BR93DRAFT_113987 [Coniochaeta sp. PMI_546]|nr:hypothetical protein BR93DRAFT_113987 [Coniochaeta sp. PMI_546]
MLSTLQALSPSVFPSLTISWPFSILPIACETALTTQASSWAQPASPVEMRRYTKSGMPRETVIMIKAHDPRRVHECGPEAHRAKTRAFTASFTCPAGYSGTGGLASVRSAGRKHSYTPILGFARRY